MSLGLGILSFAHGHVAGYADEIRKMSDARVVAAWDDDVERGRKQSQAAGAEFVPDLNEFLARKDVQGVFVASETSRHAEHAEAAARAGKHVLLQKPMALTLADCDRIASAVARAGVKFSLLWQMRSDPQNAWMREAVRSGRFGKIAMVRRRHGLGTQLWGDAFKNSWHVKRELNLGMFMDDASHAADWFLWNFGRPLSVTAEIETVLDPKIPDDNGVAVFRFPGGTIGILESSFTTVAADETTAIFGEKGAILQRWGDAPSCSNVPPPPDARGLRYIHAGEKDWTTVDIPTPRGHFERIRALARPAVEFLLGKREAIATAEEGRACSEMILSAYASAREGRRITFS